MFLYESRFSTFNIKKNQHLSSFGAYTDHFHLLAFLHDLLILQVFGLEPELIVLVIGIGDAGACRKGESCYESCDKGKVFKIFHNAVIGFVW